MRTFLIVFLSAYSAMHALVFWWIRVLLPDRLPGQILCAFFFVAMILAPLVVRPLEKGGHIPAARLIAWIGYGWMGFILLSFCAFLLLSIYDLFATFVNMAQKVHMPLAGGAPLALCVIGIVGLVFCYGFTDARRIRTERVSIKTAKLPAGVDRLKVVQISDVHLGLMGRSERMGRILDKVRELEPDILVSTGDLLDGELGGDEEGKICELFSATPARFGKYAITGNHESYAGLTHSLDLTRSFGFKVLRCEAVEVFGLLTIAGIDDPAVDPKEDEKKLLSSISGNRFVLFLKHRPSVSEKSPGLFDLQLSGHTHRGQIFPFNLVTGWFYPLQDGFYKLGRGSMLYTSRGTGSWGPPIRVLSPPEVTLFELVSDGAQASKRQQAPG